MDNNEGIAGIAPNCRIMPIRIFNANGSSVSQQSTADAIMAAVNNGASIISNSWGYTTDNPNFSPVIIEAIRNAVTNGRGGKGCVVLFAAGNTANHVQNDNGNVEFPANVNIPGVLTVGVSDSYDHQANYSPTSNPESTNNQLIDILADYSGVKCTTIPGQSVQ